MHASSNTRRHRIVIAVAAVLLAAAGGIIVAVGIWGNPAPPQPPVSASQPAATSSPAAPPVSNGSAPVASSSPAASPASIPAPVTGPVLPPSKPTRIVIPAIDVDSNLMELGLNKDGTPEVPPFDKDSPAGWYRGSPTPGQLGPSIILGHVDTYKAGPVVFYRLGDVRPGDAVSVTRADNTVAVFTVDRVESFPKKGFPELEVYGNTDSAQLRLITCGGDFVDHQYENDIVVFASLTSSHPAQNG